MGKFIYRILKDLWLTYMPSGKPLEGVAFIVHPRDYGDVVSNVPFLKKFPKSFVMKYFRYVWPFTVSSIRGVTSLVTGKELPGWVIGVPLFAREMMEDRGHAKRKIQRAVQLAKHRGAKVVGLGAMTGSMTEGGAGLTTKDGFVVTAGRAYTSFVVKSYVDDVVQKFHLQKKDITIAIVGAAGGVGTAVAGLILREEYKQIILIDSERKLEYVHAYLQNHPNVHNVTTTHLISAVRTAHIIVTVTNAPEAVIQSDDIMPGTVIVDDAQPSDIAPEIIEARKDILVVEAGVLRGHEKIRIGTNFRLANPHELYCCLGEVIAIAAGDWKGQYEPRNITPEHIDAIAQIAAQLGFSLAPYQAYGKMIPQEQIDAVGLLLQNKIKNES